MTPTESTTSLSVFVGRVFWMMIGPMALLGLAVAIVRIGNGWFTPADFAFLGVVAGLILARWMEFRAGNPQTASGDPATPAHLRRYALGAVLLGAGVWVVANLLGNYWLVR